MKGVVYDPPGQGYPYLAVVFHDDGELIVAVTVQSIAEGEELIAKTLMKLAAENLKNSIRP